jgi:chemotaxis protein CheC
MSRAPAEVLAMAAQAAAPVLAQAPETAGAVLALSELQLDALGEAFNIALGSAAEAFSELVDEEVDLSVPAIEMLPRSRLKQRLRDFDGAAADAGLSAVLGDGLSERLGHKRDPEHGAGLGNVLDNAVGHSVGNAVGDAAGDAVGNAVGNALDNKVCSVSQHFDARSMFRTDAVVVFPQSGCVEIVRKMLGTSAAAAAAEVTELEEDTLAEIGNVILNACMAALGQLLDAHLSGGLPEVQICAADTLFENRDEGEAMLIARIGMHLADKKVSGFVLLLMDRTSVRGLVREVERAFDL